MKKSSLFRWSICSGDGGQFSPVLGGQFTPVWGGQFDRNFQYQEQNQFL